MVVRDRGPRRDLPNSPSWSLHVRLRGLSVSLTTVSCRFAIEEGSSFPLLSGIHSLYKGLANRSTQRVDACGVIAPACCCFAYACTGSSGRLFSLSRVIALGFSSSSIVSDARYSLFLPSVSSVRVSLACGPVPLASAPVPASISLDTISAPVFSFWL